jgi:hypothetical protein
MTSAGVTASAPATPDLAAIRAALKADGVDAWLLYDFRGINLFLRRAPLSPFLHDIRSILFLGNQRLFFRDCLSA